MTADEVDIPIPDDAVPMLTVVVFALPGDNQVGVSHKPLPALERLDREQSLRVAPVVAAALRACADGIDASAGLERAVEDAFTGRPQP